MRYIKICIQSKHQYYIDQFIILFNKKSRTLFKSVKQLFIQKKYQPRFSVLTSPHVNKKAQEQFEIRIYYWQIKVQTFELLKLGIFLKKVNESVFPNLNFKLKLTSDILTKASPLTSIRTYRKKHLIKIIENYGV